MSGLPSFERREQFGRGHSLFAVNKLASGVAQNFAPIIGVSGHDCLSIFAAPAASDNWA
jgi:hypothetical protein